MHFVSSVQLLVQAQRCCMLELLTATWEAAHKLWQRWFREHIRKQPLRAGETSAMTPLAQRPSQALYFGFSCSCFSRAQHEVALGSRQIRTRGRPLGRRGGHYFAV
jgi:hypothetical protein